MKSEPVKNESGGGGAVVPAEAEEKKMEDVSAEPDDGAEVDAEAQRLVAVCGQDLVMKDIPSAVNVFQKASSPLGKKYGGTDDQYGGPVYSNGLALLDPARKENHILGEPLQGLPEDDENSLNSFFPLSAAARLVMGIIGSQLRSLD